MHRTAALVPLALTASFLVLPAVAEAAPVTPTTVVPAAAVVDPDPADRESMRQGYLQILKPAIETPMGWTGDIASCDAGAPSEAAQEATLTAVNYFRDLVGVEPVIFDQALSDYAQEAALIMAAEEDLSHFPPPDWACHSSAGAYGASKSNIYLGRTGADAVAGYMVDPGSNNTSAGHRRWLISPRQTTMGSGSVADGTWPVSNALYVISSETWQPVPASTPDYMPWPVAGFVPRQIEPGGRWSLSAKAAVDFSEATVTINGSAAGITVHPVAGNIGSPTLVWNFDPGFEPGDADRTYHVVVSNILTGGVPSSHAYDVTLFDADPPTLEPQEITFPTPADRTYGDDPKNVLATSDSGLPVTFSSTTPAVCTTSGGRGQTVSLEGAGTCTIAANQSGDDFYAAAPEVRRSFDVGRAELSGEPVDTSRRPGEANPAFQVSWTGFAYGETLATSGVTGTPTCSSTAAPGSAEGTYPITCSTGTLASGNYSFSFESGTLTVDGSPPAVSPTGPAFTIALGPFTLDWSADDPSGVEGMQQRETSRTPTTPFGAWTAPTQWEAPSAAEGDALPDGLTLCLSARARDTLGNVSDWTGTTCVHAPVDSSSLKAPRAWKTITSSGLWRGSALTTSRKGAALKVADAVDVDRVGIVGSRCQGCGRVAVFVGKKKVGELSLNGTKTKNKVVMELPRLSTPLSGAVKVVVVSARRKVQIDGIIASGPSVG